MLRKMLVIVGLFLVVSSVRVQGQERKIAIGANSIDNGLIKVELYTARCALQYLMWDEKEKCWMSLFYTHPIGLLYEETPEDLKIEKTENTATIEFKLVDRQKDEFVAGGGGHGEFYQVYKTTIWKDKHKAYVELLDEAEAGNGQMSWLSYVNPEPARYLIGKSVWENKAIADCRELFKDDVRVIKNTEIGTGNEWAGAYDHRRGYLYVIHYPKGDKLNVRGSKKGVIFFSGLNYDFSFYGMNIGQGKEPAFAVETAEKILNPSPIY